MNDNERPEEWSSETAHKAIAAHERLTGSRWCSSCQGYRRLDDGGRWHVTRSSKRWVCGACQRRREGKS